VGYCAQAIFEELQARGYQLIKAAKPTPAPQDDVEVRDLAVYERLAAGGIL